MRLGELAGYIQETMESYEVEVNGKVLPGKSNRQFIHFNKLTLQQSSLSRTSVVTPSTCTKYLAENLSF